MNKLASKYHQYHICSIVFLYQLYDFLLLLLCPSKHACWWRRTEDIFKTFFCLPRRLEDLFKTSSRHYWKKSSWIHLEDVLKMSSGRFWKTYCKQVLKTFSRHLQDVLGDKKLLRWRRLGKQEMFAGAWFVSSNLMVIIFHGFSNHRYYFPLIVLLEQLSFWKLTAYSHKVAIW